MVEYSRFPGSEGSRFENTLMLCEWEREAWVIRAVRQLVGPLDRYWRNYPTVRPTKVREILPRKFWRRVTDGDKITEGEACIILFQCR